MNYRCKTVLLNSLIVGPTGIVMPLCEDCKTTDCDNPIEKRSVSIMGVSRKVRSYMRGDVAYFVIDCQGFTK